MASTEELLDEFGRCAASSTEESYALEGSVLHLNVVENAERRTVIVSGSEFLRYLRHEGVEDTERLGARERETYWADLSRRVSAAASMWAGSGSVLRLNGSAALFEPEPGAERTQGRPAGAPAPAGLRVVQRPLRASGPDQ